MMWEEKGKQDVGCRRAAVVRWAKAFLIDYIVWKNKFLETKFLIFNFLDFKRNQAE